MIILTEKKEEGTLLGTFFTEEYNLDAYFLFMGSLSKGKRG